MSASVLTVGLAIVLGASPDASGGVLAPGSMLETLWSDGSFTEGGALAGDGAILFSDIGDRIMRFDPATGAVSVFREPSGRANGLIFDPRGRLIAAEGANSGGGRRVSITEPDGTVRTLADRYQGKRFNSPNDLAVDRLGRVYVSDPRYVGDDPRELDFEGVFRIDPDGSVHRLETTAAKPNGLAISPDGTTLYVADTGPSRRALLALDLGADGAVARPRILHDFGAGRGVDGLTVATDGRIVAAAGNGPEGGVHVFDPLGKPVAFIPVPEPPTNVEFGGPDRTALYITAGKSLYRIRTTMTGHHLGPPEVLGQAQPEPGHGGTPAKFAGRIFLSSAGQDDALRGVVAIDPNDGSRQTIATEVGPRARVSPDGSRLAVRRYGLGEPDPGLWIYQTTGAKESFRVSEREALPCWSPDGKELLLGALARARGREIDYWRIAADGSREERVPIPVTEHILDWSPDGLWLLTFSSRKLPDRPFCLMHPDGTGERLLLADDSGPGTGGTVGISGRFSPDSRKVLFDQIVRDKDVRPIQIKSTALLELDVESGKVRRFFVREGGDFSTGGSWSPDGKAIAVVITEGPLVFPRPPDAKTHIEVVDRDGRVLKTIPLPGPSIARNVIDWR